MDRPKVLLVFYSRSGHTRAVAHALSDALSCDVEEIIDETDRRGLRGYLRCAVDAVFHRKASVLPLKVDPTDYDLVIVGTPVWNASVSAPVRTFLEVYSGRLRRVAFFLSYGGSGKGRVFRQMERLAGTKPLTKLAVRERTIDHDRLKGRLEPFVEDVRTELKAEASAQRSVDDPISVREPAEATRP